jgi:hypothetical protein
LASKVLELVNRLSGAGLLLKDVSLEVHNRELTAVFGYKDTGNLHSFGEGWCHLKDISFGKSMAGSSPPSLATKILELYIV